ncbi:hypothetical protein ACFWFI_42585, partial [Streptomyces sp. NPDC060209]|uniref:hypothetical protein n=1 Tax=Streptomyces sp. NPDC060209 TaxID=3347073 RepID=UPI0036599BEE
MNDRLTGRPPWRTPHSGQRRPGAYDEEGARARRPRREAPRQRKALRARRQGAVAWRGNVVRRVRAVGA